jgi:hypothetical protein
MKQTKIYDTHKSHNFFFGNVQYYKPVIKAFDQLFSTI